LFAFVIAVFACVLLSGIFAALSLGRSGRVYEVCLHSKINPNNAPAESLVRLPGIGIVRAGAIIAYRVNFIEKQGQGQAFETIDDLQKVRGIGAKTVQNISKWLKFEKEGR